MQNPTVTFVTAFIDLYEDSPTDKLPTYRINLFRHIANSGVAICLYVSSKYENIGKEFESEYKNIKLMQITNIENTETYKIIKKLNPVLPINKTDNKDTINFLILMNAKSEFVYNASLINPFNTEHFAWIDFNIFHVINNIEHATSKLKLFGFNKLKPTMMLFPCSLTPEITNTLLDYVKRFVLWRFCGGFFIGDKISIKNMHNLMLLNLPTFIQNNGENIITWEVNMWAWLEINHNWQIDCYYANHDNTILDIPKEYMYNY